jgi:hypothetical protein
MKFAHARIAAMGLAGGLVMLNVTSAYALLPPYWQSAAEIKAIVDDQRVHDALKYEEPITSVTVTGDHVYELKTPRCSLTVKVVEKPGGGPGPAQFELSIGTANCQ